MNASEAMEQLNELECVRLGYSMTADDIAAVRWAVGIIDRLPRTADGVPVVPSAEEEDKVYWCVHKGEVHEVRDWYYGDLGWRGHAYEVPTDGDSVLTKPPSLCYSTREAAEAALAKPKEGPTDDNDD